MPDKGRFASRDAPILAFPHEGGRDPLAAIRAWIRAAGLVGIWIPAFAGMTKIKTCPRNPINAGTRRTSAPRENLFRRRRAGGNACQPTTMQVTVLTIPETVWISRVTICPTAFRSLAETMAMMS